MVDHALEARRGSTIACNNDGAPGLVNGSAGFGLGPYGNITFLGQHRIVRGHARPYQAGGNALDARKVSRQQARIELGADSKWSLTATGRRALSVDGAKLSKGERCELRHLSLIEAGGVRMMFVVNARGVRRAVARSGALGL